jgi:hypothetical protein
VKLINLTNDQFQARVNEPKAFTNPDNGTALQAFSDALEPLGEALRELGQAYAHIAQFNLAQADAAHRHDRAAMRRLREQTREVISGPFEASEELLEAVVSRFAKAAAQLMPPAYRVARTRSPRSDSAARSAAQECASPSVTPHPTTSQPAKGRS